MLASRYGITMNGAAHSLGKGFCCILVTLFTLACTQPESGNPPPPAARIIVKFVDASRSPPDNLNVEMPDGTAVLLRHERRMSGNAYLYNGRMNRKQRAMIVHTLNERPEIDYAEPDRKLSY